MGRTFNRAPAQFNTPSSSDVKNYYFNHFNWKGIDRNKNFLGVDQETFADAKNVYVDEEGLLKSRPSLKPANFRPNAFSENVSIDKFDEFIVLTTYYLESENAGKYAVRVMYGNNEYIQNLDTTQPNYLYRDGKIYIFANTVFKYFDCESKSFADASPFVYVPETRYITASTVTDVEYKNILTDREMEVYGYNPVDGVSTGLYNKRVLVKNDLGNYEFEFNNFTKNFVMEKRGVIPTDHQVIVSDKGQFALYDTINGDIFYSAIGSNFKYVTNINPDRFQAIKFSHDCNYLIVGVTGDVFVLKVVEDEMTTEVDGMVFDFNKMTSITEYTDVTRAMLNGLVSLNFDFYSFDDFFLSYITPGDGLYKLNYYLYEKGVSKSAVQQQEPIYSEHDVKNVSYDFISKTALVVVTYYNKSDYKYYTYFKIFYLDEADGNGYVKSNYSLVETGIKSWSDFRIYNDLVYAAYQEDLSQKLVIFEMAKDSDVVKKTFKTIKGASHKFGSKISVDGRSIVFTNGIYSVDDEIFYDFNFEDVFPIAFSDYVYLIAYNEDMPILWTSNLTSNVDLYVYKNGAISNQLFTKILDTTSSIYFASNETLYIGEFRKSDNELKLYIPEISKQEFSNKITGLHQISSTEVAIFFDNEVYYATKTDDGYAYYKSKLDVGLMDGGNVETSDDGTKTYFVTKNGLVALSYQDFVASTDQALIYLTNAVRTDIEEFAKNPVRVRRHSYWLFMYDYRCTTKLWIYDTRNGSCWYWDFGIMLSEIEDFDNRLYILGYGNSWSKQIYTTDTSSKNYYDSINGNSVIDWYITSQKLHLNAINYYKHIANMTLSTVLNNGDEEHEFSMDMDVVNYRDYVDEEKPKTLSYKVQLIRTFVQRLNYMKINEFQYTFKTDYDNAIQLPLSLSDIGIKYKVMGQVK